MPAKFKKMDIKDYLKDLVHSMKELTKTANAAIGTPSLNDPVEVERDRYSLTEKEISDLNNAEVATAYSYEQGIYMQPSMVPTHVKELVVYKRWDTGGASGGSCWGSDAEQYEGDPEPNFTMLERLLKKFGKEEYFDEVQRRFLNTNEDSSYEYYGNYSNYTVHYILLSDVMKFLKEKENS